MNKSDLQKAWIGAATDGTLVPSKHDPNLLGKSRPSYRSVVAYEVEADLVGFLSSGEFSVRQYGQTMHGRGDAYVLTLLPTSTFSIPASGVPALSRLPTEALDRLFVVNSKKQGWHMYGESSSNINDRVTDGCLLDKGEVE